MYNYYIDLKRKKEKEKKRLEEIQKDKRKYLREIKTTKLAKSYEDRIKQFMYKMAENPIQIKDKKEKVTSTRQDLLEEEAGKILFGKGFVYSKFKPELYDLAINIDPYKNIKSALGNKNNNPLFEIESGPSSLNNPKIKQPNMRFKARTDLERIYDTLMQYNPFEQKAAKTILNEQLNELGYHAKKINTNNNNNENEVMSSSQSDIEEEDENRKDKKEKKNKIDDSIIAGDDEDNYDCDLENENLNASKENSKEKELEERRKYFLSLNNKFRVDNSKAKKIYADLYNRTYFKAVENFSLFKNTCLIPEKKQKKPESVIFKYNNKAMNTTNNIIGKRDLLRFKKIHFNGNKTHNKFLASTDGPFNKTSDFIPQNTQNNYDNSQEINSPTQLINMLNKKKTKKEKQENLIQSLENVDLFTQSLKDNQPKANIYIDNKNKLEALRIMAFKDYSKIEEIDPNISQRKSSVIPKEDLEDINNSDKLKSITKKGGNNIIIDGVPYNKNDFEHLSVKVLEKCGVRHNKNSQVENPFQTGHGKLMFTKGLTLEEFEKKYNLY